MPGAISTYGRSPHSAAFFCRSGSNEQNRENTLHGIKTVTPICFRFQVNKCPFGDKCKYRHIKDHNIIPRGNKENKDNNVANKNKITPKIPNRKFTPNNHNNRLVGPPRGKSLDGHAPSYSTMQIRTLKLLFLCLSLTFSVSFFIYRSIYLPLLLLAFYLF